MFDNTITQLPQNIANPKLLTFLKQNPTFLWVYIIISPAEQAQPDKSTIFTALPHHDHRLLHLTSYIV